MYQELTRDLREHERAAVEEIVKGASKALVTLRSMIRAMLLLSCGLSVCFVVGVVLALLESPGIVVGLIMGALLIVGIIFLYIFSRAPGSTVHWSRQQKEFLEHRLPAFQKALEDGRVQVKRVTANAVAEIRASEDEGSGYLFDVGDGRILFLKGQRFDPDPDGAPWPNTEFEIVRTAQGGHWIGLFAYGKELEPGRVIETSDCRDEIVWQDREELLEEGLNNFVDSILKKPNG